MALFPGYDPQNLNDVLSQSAGSQSANLTDAYQQQRKRLVAGEAASGRLMGGTSSYPLTDLDTQYQQGLSGIQGGLAQQESSIPEEDWLNQNQFQRSYGLAQDIASRLKPSLLQEIFQGIGTGASVAGLGVGIAGL